MIDWTLSKVKTYSFKKTGQKMKRQFTDWEKIFTTKYTIKDLYPECIKNYQNMIISKENGQMI